MRSQLRLVLAAKEQREGRTISLREVVRDTKIPISTVYGLANNSIKRVPLEELGQLCRYLECDVGDLLRMEEVRA